MTAIFDNMCDTKVYSTHKRKIEKVRRWTGRGKEERLELVKKERGWEGDREGGRRCEGGEGGEGKEEVDGYKKGEKKKNQNENQKKTNKGKVK